MEEKLTNLIKENANLFTGTKFGAKALAKKLIEEGVFVVKNDGYVLLPIPCDVETPIYIRWPGKAKIKPVISAVVKKFILTKEGLVCEYVTDRGTVHRIHTRYFGVVAFTNKEAAENQK